MQVINQVVVGYDFEQLVIANSVNVLTPSKYKNSATSGGALSAFITNETAQIRYRYDNGTPSTTAGHILEAGGTLVLVGQNQMSQFKAIRTGSTSATLTVTYERL